MGFCTDVTERKRTQRALLDSENRFRRISAMTSDLGDGRQMLGLAILSMR